MIYLLNVKEPFIFIFKILKTLIFFEPFLQLTARGFSAGTHTVYLMFHGRMLCLPYNLRPQSRLNGCPVRSVKAAYTVD